MRKNGIVAIAAGMITLGVISVANLKTNSDLIFERNVEALANGESGSNYVLCYHESRVRRGYTYYDCGTCQKVYDEKGQGHESKCFR